MSLFLSINNRTPHSSWFKQKGNELAHMTGDSEVVQVSSLIYPVVPAWVASCLRPPPCEAIAILSLISMIGKSTEKEKDRQWFLEVSQRMSKNFLRKLFLASLHAQMGLVLSQSLAKWAGLLLAQLYALRLWI